MAVVRVEFDLRAAEEVQAAKDWYAAQSSVAALSFADEVSAALSRIQEAPDRWPQAIAGTRRHALHKFPFVIFYRKKGDAIQVVAVSHAKRRPGYWRKRLE